MKIERIELRRIYLPYVRRFETSGWYEDGSFAIIVRVDADGVTGWGEAPVSDGPWYNEETYQTAWFMMQEFLGPMLLKADVADPRDTRHVFKKVRANRMAKSGLEFAVWDLFGRAQNVSLSKLLGGTRDRVDVGVSVPIQPDIPTLLETVGGYLDKGYKRVKVKIKPGWDVEPTKAIRERWPDLLLQVDGNSIYHLSDAEHLQELAKMPRGAMIRLAGSRDRTQSSWKRGPMVSVIWTMVGDFLQAWAFISMGVNTGTGIAHGNRSLRKST